MGDSIQTDFQKKDGGIDWIDLAQNMDMWRPFVNMVGTFGFCKMGEYLH